MSGENFQSADTSFGGEQVRETQNAGWRKGKRMIQQYRVHAEQRLYMHLFDVRVSDAIPIFQRSFEVVQEKIHGGQEFVSIGVSGIEPERVAEVGGSLGIVLLLQGNSA